MSETLFTILPTDTRWPGPYHVEEGPDCLCSRCGLAILEPEIAIRAWPEDANAYSYRFHPTCLGFQASEPLDEDDDRDWPSLPLPGEADDDEPTSCPYCGEADCEASCTAALVQDARPSEADVPDLGPCCSCRQSGPQVRNILALPFRAPVPGTGWGCVVCGLPCDGAVAVVCEACLDACTGPRSSGHPQEVCYGYPGEGKRCAYAACTQEPFDHDATLHEEERMGRFDQNDPNEEADHAP